MTYRQAGVLLSKALAVITGVKLLSLWGVEGPILFTEYRYDLSSRVPAYGPILWFCGMSIIFLVLVLNLWWLADRFAPSKYAEPGQVGFMKALDVQALVLWGLGLYFLLDAVIEIARYVPIPPSIFQRKIPLVMVLLQAVIGGVLLYLGMTPRDQRLKTVRRYLNPPLDEHSEDPPHSAPEE